jgi:hypothetical protein
MGQHSCTKLLREMEALESYDDEEVTTLAMDDTEMLHLPESLCVEILNSKEVEGMPSDIYALPDMIKPVQTQSQVVE